VSINEEGKPETSQNHKKEIKHNPNETTYILGKRKIKSKLLDPSTVTHILPKEK
jgi:hypothetical protein